MTNVRNDLEDINRFSSIEHERRIELLTNYLDATADHTVKGQHWLIAGALLWASVRQANSDLRAIRFHAKGLLGVPDEQELLADAVKELQIIVPLIRKLIARLPDETSKFDEIISYGGCLERSWLNIAVSGANLFTVPGIEFDATMVERVFETIEYDPQYVGLQLEIEKKQFDRIRIPSKGSTGGNTVSETTVGEALEKIWWDTVTADVAPATADDGVRKPDAGRGSEKGAGLIRTLPFGLTLVEATQTVSRFLPSIETDVERKIPDIDQWRLLNTAIKEGCKLTKKRVQAQYPDKVARRNVCTRLKEHLEFIQLTFCVPKGSKDYVLKEISSDNEFDNV